MGLALRVSGGARGKEGVMVTVYFAHVITCPMLRTQNLDLSETITASTSHSNGGQADNNTWRVLSFLLACVTRGPHSCVALAALKDCISERLGRRVAGQLTSLPQVFVNARWV